jgi:hypothetical protein
VLRGLVDIKDEPDGLSRGDKMNYGKLLVELIVKGLRDEELFFSKGNAAGERSTINSVRKFNEDWVRFILLRQVIKHKKVFGQLEISSRNADFSIKSVGTARATAELKGPFEVKTNGVRGSYFREIIKDFHKQARSTEHGIKYVILLPFGEADAISRWLRRDLEPEVHKSISSRTIAKPPVKLIPVDRHNKSNLELAVVSYQVC